MDFIFIVFAFVFEVIAGLGVPSGRFNLVAAGLACFFASMIFGHFH